MISYSRFLRRLGWKRGILFGDYCRFREVGLVVRALRGHTARRVLDVGSGPGVGTSALAGTFTDATVVALDRSPELLVGSDRGTIHVLQRTATSPFYSSGWRRNETFLQGLDFPPGSHPAVTDLDFGVARVECCCLGGPSGGGVRVEVYWSSVSGIAGTEDALDLARRCVVAWQKFFTQHNLDPSR